MSETTIKSTINKDGDYVSMTMTDGVRPWYTVYTPDGWQRETTRDLAEAERAFEKWSH